MKPQKEYCVKGMNQLWEYVAQAATANSQGYAIKKNVSVIKLMINA